LKSLRGFVGSTIASIIQIKSSSELVVKLPAGTGGALLLGIEIDDEFASTPTGLWFTYDVAILGKITPLNSATTGATLLMISGTNFGFSDNSLGVAAGGSKYEPSCKHPNASCNLNHQMRSNRVACSNNTEMQISCFSQNSATSRNNYWTAGNINSKYHNI
jgi:hypothetical protein